MSGRIHRVVATLVIEGLRRARPELLLDEPALRSVMAGDDEGVPLGPYRQLLRAALDHDGGVALLRAGGALRGLSHPLLFVLLNSDSPRLLVEKEARLAAFIHSRHRVVVDEVREHGIVLTHVSAETAAPEPTEDLAACGQHIVLLEEIGCQRLRCRLPHSAAPERWVYREGEFTAPSPGGGYAQWHFEWAAYEPTRKPMPGLDEVLLGGSPGRELRETEGPVAGVERVVRRDLGRTWKLAEVAEVLDMSGRSLQRTLAAQGERYSDLVDRIRNEEAARLLRDTTLSATEIGYVCGFADSAHFSRSFKKRFGHPPSAHRRAVSGGG